MGQYNTAATDSAGRVLTGAYLPASQKTRTYGPMSTYNTALQGSGLALRARVVCGTAIARRYITEQIYHNATAMLGYTLVTNSASDDSQSSTAENVFDSRVDVPPCR